MITGKQFKDAIISAANNICRKKKVIDALNVFPVPDGDTGTNMSMTIYSAVEALDNMQVDDNTGIDEVSATIASALLRGARGNSGVILSQLFRGFATGCKGKKTLDPIEFSKALECGVDAAYSAVLKPTEGTVLTVSRMAAVAAGEAAKEGSDDLSTIEAAIQQGEKTLAETPDMLPQLKKAGVVDAGGMGYIVILEGILSYLRSGKVIELGEHDLFTDEGVEDPEFMSEDEITFTYCTEFIVDKSTGVKNNVLDLREFLASIGDSVVVVDDDEIIKIHVHTDSVGAAFDEASKYGMLEKIKVENMRVQFRARQKKSAGKTSSEPQIAAPENEYGMIAVANGEGMVGLFTELGCDRIVLGGQTMNPSTEDILKACMAVPAKNVFVFPNNKNIIMAAEQAAALAEDRKIIVIPTKTVPQGISAALAFDGELDADSLKNSMCEASKLVCTGQITSAARNSDFDGLDIKEGQILAMNEDKLSFVDKSVHSATVKLTKEIASDGASFITLFYGEGETESSAEAIASEIVAAFPAAEINVICGGQPVYNYIISVEA